MWRGRKFGGETGLKKEDEKENCCDGGGLAEVSRFANHTDFLRYSRVCAHRAGLIRKYGLMVCRQVGIPLRRRRKRLRGSELEVANVDNSASVRRPTTLASSR